MTTLTQQIDELFAFFNDLADHELFKTMASIKEDSPWHREDSILIHTEMVFKEYCKLIGDREWTFPDLLGGWATIFHDVGKPDAMVIKNKPERGEYRAFHGHEQVSARVWEDFASKHQILKPQDIFAVGWMIEHHLPWDTKDAKKRLEFARTANFVGLDTFINVLMADQFGRTSDDQEAKLARVNTWVSEFRQLAATDEAQPILPTVNGPMLGVLIGASGSGKSTFIRHVQQNQSDVGLASPAVFSLDALRHEWYDAADYRKAWQASTEDKTFASRANARFVEMVKQGGDIYVDNTNCGRKSRAFYIQEARRRGYVIVGVMFVNSLDTLIARQTSRTDKTVPEDAVRRQYASVAYPMLGEFDEIIVV